jgi:hypothetical protein
MVLAYGVHLDAIGNLVAVRCRCVELLAAICATELPGHQWLVGIPELVASEHATPVDVTHLEQTDVQSWGEQI